MVSRAVGSGGSSAQAFPAVPTALDLRLLLALAALVAGVYANGLGGAFVLDDRASIVYNESIRDLGSLGTVLASTSESPVAGRPLVNLTLAINHAIGGLDVVGYHVVNVLLHVACALLILGVVRRTLALPSVRQRVAATPTALAFAAALVWGVHPLNSEVVDYVTQRTESLAAAFLLTTLYAAIRYAAEPDTRGWAVAAVASCALGVASKESVALAPLLVALYDRAYLYDSWREGWRARRGLYLGLATTWLLAAALVASGARSASVGFSLGVSAWTYLLNQAEMIVRYLQLAFWPDSLVAFYGWPRPMALVDVLPETLVVIGLLTLTVYSWVRAPRLGYLGLWFFVLLAPTSSFVPIVTEVGAERRMYLPLAALVVLAVLGGAWLTARVGRQTVDVGAGASLPAIRVALLIAVCAALGWATIQRNREYRSELVLGRTLVERWPTGVAHQLLGLALLRDGATEEAIAQLERAVATGNTRAGSFLGRALLASGKTEAGIERLEAFMGTAGPGVEHANPWLRPSVDELLDALTELAGAHVADRRWADAEKTARRALGIDSSHGAPRLALADALLAQERWAEATVEYHQYLSRNRGTADIWINLGIAAVGMENPDDAHKAFARAAAIAPRSPDAHQYLAMFLAQAGEIDKAADHASTAIDLGSADPMLREILTMAGR